MRFSDFIGGGRASFVAVLALSLLAACSGDRMISTHPPGQANPPGTVEVPFCAAVAPDWVAFQDGDAKWTRALPVIDGRTIRFRYTFSSERGAMAAVRLLPGGRLTTLTIQYGAPAELIIGADTASLACGALATNTLFGSVAGLGPDDIAAVSAGYGASALLAASQRAFTLRGLVPGPQELLATRKVAVNEVRQLASVILRRTPDLPDSTLLSTLDFNSAEAFAPVLVRVTLGGVGPENATLTSALHTPYGSDSFLAEEGTMAGNQRTIFAIPTERLHEGDLQLATMSATAVEADAHRVASVYFRAPADQTLTFGAPVTIPALSAVATTPNLRLRARFDAQPEYDRLTSIEFVQSQVIVTVAATSRYAAVAPGGYDLVIPDLSPVSGFDPRWALSAREPAFWFATRIGGSLGLGLDAQPFAGATVRVGTRFATFNP